MIARFPGARFWLRVVSRFVVCFLNAFGTRFGTRFGSGLGSFFNEFCKILGQIFEAILSTIPGRFWPRFESILVSKIGPGGLRGRPGRSLKTMVFF